MNLEVPHGDRSIEAGREMLNNKLKKIGKPLTTNDYPRNKEDIPHKLI